MEYNKEENIEQSSNIEKEQISGKKIKDRGEVELKYVKAEEIGTVCINSFLKMNKI